MKSRSLKDILINYVIAGLLLTLCSQNQVFAQQLRNNNSVLPTTEEITETNARLPVLVAEGTLWTKVEYDRVAKIQKFYYRYTDQIDNQLISSAKIQGKELMKNALKQNPRSMARINAGMTYVYVYCSKNNSKLYEIRINKSDF